MGIRAKATPLRMIGVAIFAVIISLITNRTAQAKDLHDDYTLSQNMTEQIVIMPHENVVLNLNGHNITVDNQDAIVVEKGATLTVIGDGTVEATGSGPWLSLYNKAGDVTLNGGTFLKDASRGSYYTIMNHGSMVINDGATVKMNGALASMIDNGYVSYTDSTNDKNGHIADLNYEQPILTINGGVFDGGLNTVKNDDNGILIINGGSFRNTEQVAIMNWNQTTINGGNFNVPNGAAVSNGGYGPDSVDRGIFVINDGIFDSPALLTVNVGGDDYEPIKVTGGVFNAMQIVGHSDAKDPIITGGLFTNTKVVLPTLPNGYYAYLLPDGSKLVTDQQVDFDTKTTLVNVTIDGATGQLSLDDFVLQNSDITVKSLDGGEIELSDDGQITAVKAGTVLITVQFNGQTKEYVVNVKEAVQQPTTDDEVPEVTKPVENGEQADATDESWDNSTISAPNTGTNDVASESVSSIVAVTTGIVMLLALAGIRILCKEEL